jgi:hypothetical protein
MENERSKKRLTKEASITTKNPSKKRKTSDAKNGYKRSKNQK